jgi:hypothetical protein
MVNLKSSMKQTKMAKEMERTKKGMSKFKTTKPLLNCNNF